MTQNEETGRAPSKSVTAGWILLAILAIAVAAKVAMLWWSVAHKTF